MSTLRVASCRYYVERYLVPTHASIVCRDPSECSFRFITCLSMRCRGIYSLPFWLSDPTPRDTRAAVAEVEMACTPFSNFGAYRPRGMLIRFHRVVLLSAGSLYSPKRAWLHRLRATLTQPLLECMWPLAHFAGVVLTNLARLPCCRCFTACHCFVQGRLLP